jgi:hypothetical protein
MKRVLPWMGLGLIAVAFGGASYGCGGSDDNSGSGGKAGTGGGGGSIIDSGTGATGGGTGATGGGGTGGTSPQTKLGRGCVNDNDCDSANTNLTCMKADSTDLDNEGPAKGLCTIDCTADQTVCATVGDANSVCQAYTNGKSFCMEGCQFGPASLTALDAKKCHGRSEMACSLISETDTTNGVCLPLCNSDADCGGSLFCDPNLGTCSATAPTGDPVGAPCTQPGDAGTADTCKGQCGGLVHASGQQPFTYMCFENCTQGVAAVCGWGGPNTGPAPAACLFGPAVLSSTAGFGDQGSCGALCDCNADCANPALVCGDFSQIDSSGQLAQGYQKKGWCTDPLLDDGGTDPGLPTCSGTGGTGGQGGAGGAAGAAGAAGSGGTAGAAGAPVDAGSD